MNTISSIRYDDSVRWTVLFSLEVRDWYATLTPKGRAQVGRVVALLEERGPALTMPHSRQLGDGLRELRFTCENVAQRITYVLDPEHQAVTLITFRKQRQNERAEVSRARRALAVYRASRKGQ